MADEQTVANINIIIMNFHSYLCACKNVANNEVTINNMKRKTKFLWRCNWFASKTSTKAINAKIVCNSKGNTYPKMVFPISFKTTPNNIKFNKNL